MSLIILDDFINNGPYGLDFARFIEKGGKLFYSTTEQPIHDKFCIIDDKKVITGSYNWTYCAEYKNHENEVVLLEDVIVAKYKDEFDRIKNSLTLRKQAVKYHEYDLSKPDFFASKEYLANDLLHCQLNILRSQ